MIPITVTDPDSRPLRKDAERNRRRILAAARELFAQRGLGVTLNDIAHHAGVGVGTVYRRFPDKSVLIEALFAESLTTITELLDQARADPDPWHGLVGFLERLGELQSSDRGMHDLIIGTRDAPERLSQIREQLVPAVEELVARAQTAGRLRTDISPQDLPVIQLMLDSVTDASRDIAPELWRRYLGILTRGMSARPDDEEPLAAGPLSAHDIDRLVAQHKTSRQRG